MRTHFGTFRAASAITKQTAERFRLQTVNSTRQIRPVIFSISAFAPSAPREIGEFSGTFSGALAPIRRAQPPLDLTHVFWEVTNRRPPWRLIQPLRIEGNAMVTLNVYVDIEPMPKIQSMPRVPPALRGKFRSSWCARSRAPRGAARQRRESSRPSPPGTYCVPRAPPSLLSR